MNQGQHITIGLSAVIVSLKEGHPQVMVAPGPALPAGPFETQHRTLEQGLRAWVSTHGVTLGFVEQLYTFADKDRGPSDERFVSIGYLALSPHTPEGPATMDWYAFLPWEDHRAGPPTALLTLIRKKLQAWKNETPNAAQRRAREARIAISFPKDPRVWNEELVLQRYELLWEAGLIEESSRDAKGHTHKSEIPGLPMALDDRRILATGMARLRVKIKYRPVVFELLPERFTLLQLQETVEALAGLRIHKQNFRRLVQSQGLVEETHTQTHSPRGRPAKLFAFRHNVLRERAAGGTKVPRSS